MRNLLRGTIDTRYAWARLLLGWMLLAVGLLTPLAVFLRTFQQTVRPPVAVQAPPAASAYNSGGRRDPFKSPFDKKKEEPRAEFDVAPPRNRRPAGPLGILVGEAQLVGVVEGLGGKVAMISEKDGPVTYFLSEGARLYDGFIREISSGTVKFVREIKISSKVVDQQEIAKSVAP